MTPFGTKNRSERSFFVPLGIKGSYSGRMTYVKKGRDLAWYGFRYKTMDFLKKEENA